MSDEKPKIIFPKKFEHSLRELKRLLRIGIEFDLACALTDYNPTEKTKKLCKIELMQQGGEDNDVVVNISLDV